MCFSFSVTLIDTVLEPIKVSLQRLRFSASAVEWTTCFRNNSSYSIGLLDVNRGHDKRCVNARWELQTMTFISVQHEYRINSFPPASNSTNISSPLDGYPPLRFRFEPFGVFIVCFVGQLFFRSSTSVVDTRSDKYICSLMLYWFERKWAELDDNYRGNQSFNVKRRIKLLNLLQEPVPTKHKSSNKVHWTKKTVMCFGYFHIIYNLNIRTRSMCQRNYYPEHLNFKVSKLGEKSVMKSLYNRLQIQI